MVRLVRLREVHDSQHHEYEGLQRDHKDVKYRPNEAQDALREQAGPAACGDEPGKAGAQREQCDQQENHLAGVEVAEQTQCQRNGLCKGLDEPEQQIERHEPGAERMQQQLLQVTDRALHLDVEEDYERDEFLRREGFEK